MPTLNTRRHIEAGGGWRIAATGDPSRPYEVRASGSASAKAGADERMRRKVLAGAGRADDDCVRALSFLAEWSPAELEAMRAPRPSPAWRGTLAVMAYRLAVTVVALASIRLLVSLDGPGAGTLTSLGVGVACAVVVGTWSSLAGSWIPPRLPAATPVDSRPDGCRDPHAMATDPCPEGSDEPPGATPVPGTGDRGIHA